MLTIEQCRALLDEAGTALSDDEVRRLRDDMYAIASVAVQVVCGEGAKYLVRTPPPCEEATWRAKKKS